MAVLFKRMQSSVQSRSFNLCIRQRVLSKGFGQFISIRMPFFVQHEKQYRLDESVDVAHGARACVPGPMSWAQSSGHGRHHIGVSKIINLLKKMYLY
jgi:hypothetical protein